MKSTKKKERERERERENVRQEEKKKTTDMCVCDRILSYLAVSPLPPPRLRFGGMLFYFSLSFWISLSITHKDNGFKPRCVFGAKQCPPLPKCCVAEPALLPLLDWRRRNFVQFPKK